jgi:hypothetical protein
MHRFGKPILVTYAGIVLLLLGARALAEPGAGVVPMAKGTPWIVRHGMTSDEYQQNFDKFGHDGYTLTDVVGYDRAGEAAYAAIWHKGKATQYEARHGLTSAEYQAFFDEMVKKGFRPSHVSGYEIHGTDRYAAIFERGGKGAFISRHGMTSDEYQKAFDENKKAGFTLVEVSGYEVGGQPRFVAIWDKLTKAPTYEARHDMTPDAYQQTFDELAGKGYVEKTVTVYASGGQPRYAAIWVKTGAPPWQARHGMDAAQWQSAVDELWAQGFIPARLSVASVTGHDVFAAIWMKHGR